MLKNQHKHNGYVSRFLELVFPDHQYFGWIVVGVCFLCGALSAPGQSFAIGLYFESFISDIGVSRVSLSSIYGWATISAALVLPFVGRLADRSASNFFLGSVVIGIGTTLLFVSHVHSVWGLAIGIFFLRLLGQGAIGVGSITSVLRWFHKHRGRATAIAALGYAFGEFIMPKLIFSLQLHWGWRGSMIALSMMYFCIAIFVWIVLGLPKRRAIETNVDAHSTTQHDSSLANALRLPVFWWLIGLSIITPMFLTGILLHQMALFRFAGWNTLNVVLSLQAYAVGNLFTTYSIGLLLDKMASKFGIVVSLTMLCGGLVVPLFYSTSGFTIMVFGALLGASSGATSATNGVIWAEYFGVASIGSIKGVVSSVRNGATAVGAVAFAALAGPTGDYRLPLYVMLIFAFTGIIGSMYLPKSPHSSSVVFSEKKIQ